MSRPHPPSSDLALGAEGGRERALEMATNSPKLKCFFKLSKKVNIFIYLIELGRQHKQY
jgi:hypothetical protein